MSSSSSSVPRTIWMLWLQGWARAPSVVRACAETWRKHHRGWTLRLVTAENLGNYLELDDAYPGLDLGRVPAEALSDIVRIELLARYGGVWADGTVYCNRPLDAWIDDVTPRGFFAFDRPGPDRMVSSWFLAGAPGARIIEIWRERTRAYWRDRAERHHYFWFHYLFGDAYASDPAFRADWDATPKLSADGPHVFVPQEVRLFEPATAARVREIEAHPAPVFKLSHKLPPELSRQGSVLRWLEQRAYLEGT